MSEVRNLRDPSKKIMDLEGWKLESNNLFVDDRTPDIDRTNDDFSALLISTNTIFFFCCGKEEYDDEEGDDSYIELW